MGNQGEKSECVERTGVESNESVILMLDLSEICEVFLKFPSYLQVSAFYFFILAFAGWKINWSLFFFFFSLLSPRLKMSVFCLFHSGADSLLPSPLLHHTFYSLLSLPL